MGRSNDAHYGMFSIHIYSDWQPFGGFNDYMSDNDDSLPGAYKKTFHAEIITLEKPSKRTVAAGCETSLCQASLNVLSNVPDGTRVVLFCKSDGRSSVLGHFRVGMKETVMLGIELVEGETYELSIKIQSPSASLYNIEVHVSGYALKPEVMYDSSDDEQEGEEQEEDDDDDDDSEEEEDSDDEDGGGRGGMMVARGKIHSQPNDEEEEEEEEEENEEEDEEEEEEEDGMGVSFMDMDGDSDEVY